MIAKRIEFRNVNRSSFAKLVAYITNGQDKNERVGTVRVTNCHNENPDWATEEVEAVQARNMRTTIDKTYHLLLSFRAGENPSPEVLTAVEERICKALGYGEHQRVSAVHYDTDHVHIHIAINKIHPTRFTAHEPYYDKRTLGTLCEVLERDYDLAVDNHIPYQTQGEARAQDMERAAGIESLIGWMKRGCLKELLAATGWEELHHALARNGLSLQERGNGLVVTDGTSAAKARSVSRNRSKNALEKKLGPYRAMTQQVTPVARYEAKPVVSNVDTRQLWEQYQQEKSQRKQRHAVLKERARQRKERRVSVAIQNAKAKRAMITLTKGRKAKNMLYRAVSESFNREVAAIHQDYRKDQQKVYEKGRHVVWYDWLKAKAWEGDSQALEVLRNRYERTPVQANAIGGENVERVNYRAGAKIEAVTKRGTVHYQVAQTVLRDDGRVFRLAEKVSSEVIEASLKLAILRFGPKLNVTGTEEFRRQAIEAGAKMNIMFLEPEMEKQRQALTANDNKLTSEDATQRYIAERNGKREKCSDILPHRPFTSADAGKFAYAGLRYIEDKTLLLLKNHSEMLVLPIDEPTANRVRRMSIDTPIDITPQGRIRSRTRRM